MPDIFVGNQTMPDLVAGSEAQAIADLYALGIELIEYGTPQYSDVYEEGVVMAQNPAPGASVDPQTQVVTLQLSLGVSEAAGRRRMKLIQRRRNRRPRKANALTPLAAALAS